MVPLLQFSGEINVNAITLLEIKKDVGAAEEAKGSFLKIKTS